MIVVVLEDVKGFRKCISMPRFLPTVRLPMMKVPIDMYTSNVDAIVHEFAMDVIIFEFDRWLENHKVGLYKEIA